MPSAFSELFSWHMNNGTRPAGRPDTVGTRWSNKEFAGVVKSDEKTIRNWRNDKARPNQLGPVEAAFFGDNPVYGEWKRKFRAAYDGGATEDPAPRPTDWDLAQPVITPGIAELAAHPPVPANNNGYYLHASLRLGAERFEQNNEVVWIGLREVTVTIQSDGYQMAQNSRLGERAPHDHVQPEAMQLRVSGPLKDGALTGSPFGEDHLGIIERKAAGAETVHLHALAGYGDFIVKIWGIDQTMADAVTPEASTKRAVLDALIAEGMGREKDQRGRLILAHARLRLGPPGQGA